VSEPRTCGKCRHWESTTDRWSIRGSMWGKCSFPVPAWLTNTRLNCMGSGGAYAESCLCFELKNAKEGVK
jgi:hypothetical protein